MIHTHTYTDTQTETHTFGCNSNPVMALLPSCLSLFSTIGVALVLEFSDLFEPDVEALAPAHAYTPKGHQNPKSH